MDRESPVFAFEISQNTISPLPHEVGAAFYLFRICDPITFSEPLPEFGMSREARAILDWTAFRLDMWLSDRPHLVGGRITIDSSRSVLFDTDVFVRWVYALMN